MSGSYGSEHLMTYFLCVLKGKVTCGKSLGVLGFCKSFQRGKIFLNDHYEHCKMLSGTIVKDFWALFSHQMRFLTVNFMECHYNHLDDFIQNMQQFNYGTEKVIFRFVQCLGNLNIRAWIRWKNEPCFRAVQYEKTSVLKEKRNSLGQKESQQIKNFLGKVGTWVTLSTASDS